MKKHRKKSGNKHLTITDKVVLITAILELSKTIFEIIKELLE